MIRLQMAAGLTGIMLVILIGAYKWGGIKERSKEDARKAQSYQETTERMRDARDIIDLDSADRWLRNYAQ